MFSVFDGLSELSKVDEIFIKELQLIYARFIESDKQELKLEPMNSYQRRLAHKLSSNFRMESTSTGEENERAVVLKKTDQTCIPNKQKFKAPSIDTGNETFYAKPGVQIVLRSDGSFGIPWKDKNGQYLDKRVIHDGMFRIRRNQIVCKGDTNW